MPMLFRRRGAGRKRVATSPILTKPGGCKQYIAIVVGEGGFHARSFAPLVPEFRSPPNRGATLWVFALPE